MAFKRLVNRRRLVHFTGNRHEIIYVKYPREEITVPANNIQRVKIINIIMKLIVFFNLYKKLTLLIDGYQLLRGFKITLAVRRMLKVLAQGVFISLGSINGTL